MPVLLSVLGIAATDARCSAADQGRADGAVTAKKPPEPIFILNAAGVDRVLGSADGLLKMVERPQLSLALRGLLAVSTNGLKGIDRKRPVGLMTFINPGEAPEPVGVVYVPVTSGPEFLASLKAMEFTVKPAAGLAGGYEVTAGEQAFAVRIRGRYAFLARSPRSLKRELGNPAARFSRLSRDYDVCLRFQLDATPAGLKAMVLDYVRASAEMGFEKRRGETAAAHRLRKAIGKTVLRGFEEAVRDGRSLTLGLKVGPRRPDRTSIRQTAKSEVVRPNEVRTGRPDLLLEARLAARPDSPLANGLNDLRANRKQSSAAGPKSTDFRLATNWKPPASLVPLLNAFVAALPAATAGGGKSEWPLLRQGLFTTGIRLVAWYQTPGVLEMPGVRQPATFAVLSFPNAEAAAAQVRGALSEFRSRGLVRTEKVDAAQTPGVWHRVTWPSPEANTAGAVALVSNSAWVAVGRGKVLALLQQELKAESGRRKAEEGAPQSALRVPPSALFHLSGRWSVVKSLFVVTGFSRSRDRLKPVTTNRNRFELSVSDEPNTLVVRASVPPAAVREAVAPVLKRLSKSQ